MMKSLTLMNNEYLPAEDFGFLFLIRRFFQLLSGRLCLLLGVILLAYSSLLSALLGNLGMKKATCK